MPTSEFSVLLVNLMNASRAAGFRCGLQGGDTQENRDEDAAIAALKEAWADREQQLAAYQDVIDEIITQRKAAEAKLRAVQPYLQHKKECPFLKLSLCDQPGCGEFHDRPCTCGLRATLAAAPEQKK